MSCSHPFDESHVQDIRHSEETLVTCPEHHGDLAK
jgi:hypothetical protein